MLERHIPLIAASLSIKAWQVLAVVKLLAEGGTVPFIARYRKEATGTLDEVVITAIRDELARLMELDKRREAIIKSLEERNLLTDELKAKVLGADTLSELEDIYLPFRPKRRTRATVARERGLEPLAKMLFAQEAIDPLQEALAFVSAEKDVPDVESALAGARDIIAEWVNEHQEARERMRALFADQSVLSSRVLKDKETEGAKFRDYFDWQEPAKDAPSHRILAMRRGETEGFLTLRLQPQEETALAILESLFVTSGNAASEQVRTAVRDSYKRLMSVSMEAELRLALKKRADSTAISVFAQNVRQLLLAPPLGQKNIMAVDPGFRTGCKVVCLDAQGKLLFNTTVQPHTSEMEARKAVVIIRALCDKFKVEAIAIGNGTAGRETETFIRSLELPRTIDIIMVNESGASIYSASDVARQEFPDQDLTVRGSVSIGRRLMDPLAELVKIDPRSIGVGQYQHDVDQNELRRSLDDTVLSCVNAVGVELNTSSQQLLSYVSGLGPSLAQNIVAYRNENGPFKSRRKLLEVPRLGPKAFEQAAGFLRIHDAVDNPLDRSAVHPESYHIVERMAQDAGCTVAELMERPELRKGIALDRYVTDTVGMPTLTDIMRELEKPGRDPRQRFEQFRFADGVEKIEHLKQGMRLPGIVTNITDFGAFVDVGVHQDGLVHISQISDRFVKHPSEAVTVGQHVQATVMSVDIERSRIALSLKTEPVMAEAQEGDVLTPKARREAGSPRREAPVKPGQLGSMQREKGRKDEKPKKMSNTAMADALRKLSGGKK